MRKASIVVSPFYQNNRLFDLDDPIVNRDNGIYIYWFLREKLKEKGVLLATDDIHTPENSDIVLYIDVPVADKVLPKPENIHKSLLILGESEVVLPHNWVSSKYKYFNKVFTWHDGLVDGEKYIKLNFCRLFDKKVPVDISEKVNFCTVIAGNKTSSHPLELYSKRLEAIDWFDKNHPDQLDFYGRGWDKKVFKGLLRPFNRVNFMKKVCAKKYPTWKGEVNVKHDLLRTYKFTIAFENAQEIQGYITGDKIFDALQAGSIPLYWGAPNITDYVPKNCFIDWRDFGNWPDMYEYLINLTEAEHKAYLKNIQNYIANVALKGPFSEHGYVEALMPHIEKALSDK